MNATPKPTRMIGLVNADEIRYYLTNVRYPSAEGWTHERIAEKLGLSAGFVGMVLSGAREPSRAFLKAAGIECIKLYRLKGLRS